MSPIRQRIRHVINTALRADVPDDVFERAQRLDEIVTVDSLTTVEFAMALETEFGVDLTSTNPGRDVLIDLDLLERRLRDSLIAPRKP